MPRLFTGIEIPAEIALTLSGLRGGLPGARWIDPANYHLTLRFIGDISAATAGEIADALGRVDRAGFELGFEGIAAFGSRKPHAIVARVGGSRALTALQAEHERIVQRIGLPPEGRKFMPHVTLARLRGVPAREVADYLSLRAGFGTGRFPVQRFVLYSSRDSVGGGPYVVEQAYRLRHEGSGGGQIEREQWLSR